MQQQPPNNQQYPQGQMLPPQYPLQGYQQQPIQPVPAPKKRGRGLLIVGIVVAVIIFGCIGASLLASHGATATNTGSSKVGTTDSGTTPTAQPTQASNYKVGDVVRVGNSWDITVLSAKSDNGNDTFQPKSGMRYLVLSLAMKNLTSENHTISSIIQFTLRSDDGTKYDTSLYAPDGTTQIDGDVNGGQPAKGVIVYEVPKTVSSFQLTFENTLTPDQATWSLKA